MILRHVTPACNRRSILSGGLLIRFARTKRKVVWLHILGVAEWADKHCRIRHKTEHAIAVFVNVPRSWLRRSGRWGVWTCDRDIPPERFCGGPNTKNDD